MSPVILPETKLEPKPELEGSDDEDEELADGDLSSVKPRTMEPCKLVSTCQRPGENLSDDVGLHSGVGRANRFKDDARKDRGAVRDFFLCTGVTLSHSGVGMSCVLVEW